MKKNNPVVFITAFLILVLTAAFLIIRTQNHMPAPSGKPPAAITQNKESTVGLKSIVVPAQITAKQPVEEYFKEFTLPPALKAKLLSAIRNGVINDAWGIGQISKDELRLAGFIPARLTQPLLDTRTKNITAGFSVAIQTFVENLNNTLPAKNAEDEQTRLLNSDALSAMGFSSLMEHNYTQAEEAFRALIRDYADTQPAPIVHLELARLVSSEGHPAEARQLVDKAVSLYSSDKEYINFAQSLKNEIKINEQENRLRR